MAIDEVAKLFSELLMLQIQRHDTIMLHSFHRPDFAADNRRP